MSAEKGLKSRLKERGVVVSERGGDGRRKRTSASFALAGLCPILGTEESGVLAKQ